VQGNYIGTDLHGTGPLGNAAGGVVIGESSNNLIADNVVSGNDQGVVMFIQGTPAAASGNIIRGNKVGTNADGTAAIANRQGVVVVLGASNNTIGGVTAADRNVIAGNTELSSATLSPPVMSCSGTTLA
jgi:parallel beta-helix repeat protein